MKTPEICPNCSEPVPRKARSCPHCGSDESTGWSDAALAHHNSIPDDEFDYNDFVRREFGTPDSSSYNKPTHITWFWWGVALLLLLLITLPLLFSAFH